MRKYLVVLFTVLCCLATRDRVVASDTTPPAGADSRLDAATRYVEASERYLHQSHLRRGMTGYGLTVMEGTERVRFDVEIVSVLVGYGPHQDVILARLSGQGLEVSGIIAGMSGSPVYIEHEGRDKLIGAVAYGWAFQKSFKAGPLCGIQPISQMLTASGVDLGETGLPKTQPAEVAAVRPTRLPAAWRERMFAVEKTDFAAWCGTTRSTPPDRSGGLPLQMTPLSTPLMVGGLGDRALAYLAGSVQAANLVPMQSGQMGPAIAEEVAGLKLEPGSSLAIPMITGDEEASAIGTVTDVIGDHVIGLGHSMFSEGRVQYPMATGYVHTVVASLSRSFKLGAFVKVVGEIRTDETTGVAGVIGGAVDMIPMKVAVQWPDGRDQAYQYQILRERAMTPLLVLSAVMDSVWGTRGLPKEHTVHYEVQVDFGPLGAYRVANMSSANDIYEAGSDLSRPLVGMLNNPFGEAKVGAIGVTIRISEGTRAAAIEGMTLDRNRYAPGEEVIATVQFRRYRGERFTQTIKLRLPEDLPEGEHALRVGDWRMAQRGLQERRPRLFQPRDLDQLLVALQRSAETRADRLYAQMDLPRAGVTVDTQTITDAPPTVAAILSAAKPLDVTAAAEAVTADVEMDLVVSGSAEATVTVARHPPRP